MRNKDFFDFKKKKNAAFSIRASKETLEQEFEPELAIRLHQLILGHNGYGVTELRTFDKKPLVAHQERGYSPTNCTTIRKNGFCCHKFGQCQVRAPMYLTHLFSIWNK